MDYAEKHRMQPATGRIEFFDYSENKFSAFDFLSKRFLDASNPYPLQRCFSIARSKCCKSLVVEKILSVGFLADENEALKEFNCKNDGKIFRLSFWRRDLRRRNDLKKATNRDILGYVILKGDEGLGLKLGWHVFESVFVKYGHSHNCVPQGVFYNLRVGDVFFSIKGVLYCQQNRLTKTCAQVSLRTLLSRFGCRYDIGFNEINRLAKQVADHGYTSSMGLDVKQIRHILKSMNVRFWDVYYPNGQRGRSRMATMPFQRVLYSGIESGWGSLLWFKYRDRDGQTRRHIIPFFGHTFNKDAWVSDAQRFYFNVDDGDGYLPSENWTSNFIGHDDNFGSDLCVPRFFVNERNVEYAVALLPPHAEYPGVTAEVLAWGILEALVDQLYLDENNNIWRKRLLDAFVEGKYVARPQIVLRTIYMESDNYCDLLSRSKDKFGNIEAPKMISSLREIGAQGYYWVVEVSLPQLFSANEAKVGEIVLDAALPIRNEGDMPGVSVFVFARLPGAYFFYDQDSERFIKKDSKILSHTPLAVFAR